MASKKSSESGQSLIHVKFDLEEALRAKKGILNTEITLLKISRNIERYKGLRIKEMTLKESLLKKTKEARASLNHLKKVLPKPQTPEISRKTSGKKTSSVSKAHEAKKDTIESQLLDIQRKLDMLQSQDI